ncbi:anthrax toxin lethal factor-related metalloendopeptidase [Bacillus sp. Marseille-Q1617]|uniref:anthrax toxin lethal factor-related metalloendopeptidase n=1 Tax=Bacillus sp. Marseille-Q1617 TaxID=2736887 RepID=UPI0015888545|nr:toxin [Bacillus sp. Marseille-Q1617]
MKRAAIFLFLIIASFIIWKQTQASYSGILLKHSSIKSSMQLNSDEQLENIVLLPESDFDQSEARGIIRRLDHIPSHLLSAVENQEIKIRLFDKKLTDFSSTSHLKGVKPRGYTNKSTTWDDVPGIGGSKLVLVKIGHSERGMGHDSVNLELHELAHSIDRYIINDPYSEMAFMQAWKKEAALLFPGQSYFIDYQEEYFAETFAMYYFKSDSRNLLKRKAPSTYQYFKSLN